MASVLGTNFSNAMGSRSGFLSLNDVMSDELQYYTFKDCIKIKDENFSTWVCYWEDSPIAIQMSVKASKLSNGFIKVAILSKEIKTVQELGEYPAKSSTCIGNLLNGKFLTNKGVQSFVIGKSPSDITDTSISVPMTRTQAKAQEKKELTEAEIARFKAIISENWGCTLK